VAAAGAADRFSFQVRHQSELELSTLLEGSDVVVFPYREIDASGAFACASQFGKPIIATDLGVFAERPVRDHLRLVRPESPQALAAALEDLIGNPALRAALATRSAALQGMMYTWERFARDCLEIYGRLEAARWEPRPALYPAKRRWIPAQR
jgi:glycosyltransferase involved in cell wall biosynthesis